VREQYSAIEILLEYSIESLKTLDKLLDSEAKNGLINPTSSFANKGGMILRGIAGYLANVSLQNSKDSKIGITPKDENWYLNFKLESNKGWTPERAQRFI
jgi:hypothetical protein